MVKVTFIILHYKDELVTSRCVDSILRQDGVDAANILVVDNASNNESIDKLKLMFSKNDVDYLVLKEAKGFSYANNVAYKYSKEKYNSDLYIFTNNDVIFEQQEFLKHLSEIYLSERFDLLGPDIIDLKTGIHCNPLNGTYPTLEEARVYLRETERKLHNPIIGYCLEESQEKWLMLKQFVKKNLKIKKQKNHWDEKQEGCYLWGACLVFSKEFLNKKYLPFFPETRFYHEEQILHYQANKLGSKIIYDPSLCILHEQGQATKRAFEKSVERKKFQWANNVEGTDIYIRMLENDK